VKEHGEHVNWENLTDMLNKFDCGRSSVFSDVGKAQCMLPMHAIQEYCQPNRSFCPCPNFKSDYELERNLPNYLNMKKLESGGEKLWPNSEGFKERDCWPCNVVRLVEVRAIRPTGYIKN